MLRISFVYGADFVSNQRQRVTGVAVYLLLAIPLVPYSLVWGQDAKKELPGPEMMSRDTKDGVTIRCTYYGGLEGKKTIPIIMVHDFKGQRGHFDRLAQILQKARPEGSFAIIIPDLRGHGQSVQGHNEKGSPITLSPDTLKPADFERMAQLDLEVVKSFLMEKNNAGELNINQLAVIGAGTMGSAVALNWTLRDWSWPPTLNGKQGQDVAAFVLLSPTKVHKKLNTAQALAHPFVGGKLSAMIVHGTKEPDAVNIYKQLETRHAPIPKTEEDKIRNQDLWELTLETDVKGISFLAPQFGLNLEEEIYNFLRLRLFNKRDDGAFAWSDRARAAEGK